MIYDTSMVKEYMYAYGEMVHLVNTFPGGVTSEKYRKMVEEAIAKANEIPDELRDRRFEYNLEGLENIVQGLPAHSINVECG